MECSFESSATAPITTTAGPVTVSLCRTSATSANDDRNTRCSGLVPFSMTATDVLPGNPPSISRVEISRAVDAPIYSASVCSPSANCRQSMFGRLFVAWPVTKVTADEVPRCVRGMPAAAAQPLAAVIPGTISTEMPRRRKYSCSSPPLPKMNGSPPFSRTTRCPSWARRADKPVVDDYVSFLQASSRL